MHFRTLIITAIFFLEIQGYGQQIHVISSSDRQVIENVAVFNTTRERAAITDSLGRIELSIFRPSDTVIFQHPSYVTATYIKKDISGTEITLQRKRILIDEYVISASKSRESKMIIPNMVDVIENRQLLESTGLTAAEILEETGNIMVQKTQGGGGSPILRGFEANKILLVVDGVRLNNAIYRNGHLQNSITIDQSILERIEVIFGPSSIIYGSDALGGVIHYYTRDPTLFSDSSFHLDVRAYAQYASAMKGKTGHIDFALSKRRWATLTSFTLKDLGDIRMGARRNPTLGDWGKLMHYVGQVNGMDSTIANEDPLIQKNTGYRQIDFLQKIRYAPSRYVDWIMNFQYSTSSDIDRLDMLNNYSGNNLQYASYYYGPQNRLLFSLKNVVKKDNRLFTNMTSTAAWQRIDEDRYSRKFRNEELLSQQENVTVLSFNLDLLKIWNSDHKLNYGADFAYNLVDSRAWYKNIYSGVHTPTQTRYPDGGSRTWSTSAYASYKWILNRKLVLNGGARYNWGTLISRFIDTPLPYDRIEIRHGALTGSVGLVFTTTQFWQINAILSSGFRNPNVDDYGKVRAKDGEVTIPNGSLSPEYSYNAEIGINRVVEGFMKIELTGYYTYLRDAIVRTETQINGKDSLYYDGEYYQIITNYNAGQAYIYGASIGLVSNLNRQISLKSTLNFTRGHNITDNVPLGHIPPLFGRTSITYRKQSFFVEALVVYSGWKHREDFSPYGEDNDEEAMEDGFPSWWTANLKGGVTVGKRFDFLLAIENLLDQFYKPYASGISAPGRNFIITARFHL